MAKLFTPYKLKNLELKNRVVLPPMCQYSVHTKDGMPNEWHNVHYISRAVGGTGLIIVEMTAVHPDGRITDEDTGIWSDEFIPAWRHIVDQVHSYGSKIGIQLGHAGRKAEDANPPVAPSAIAYNGEGYKEPHALSTAEVEELIQAYGDAARRAVEAGFDTVEIHGAHGYLVHQFHSPLVNKRDDEYGKDLPLFGERVVQAVRQAVPDDMAVLMRVSAREYVDHGYSVDEIEETCRRYRDAGVDMLHVSSGGEGPVGAGGMKVGPAYQAEMAAQLKRSLNIPVIAVGLLDEYEDAERVLEQDQADLVAIGRAMLRDPYWPVHAAKALHAEADVPVPYLRGYRH
ncbi:NADH:flavin oxidoreductase/NADH oxidase [Paenibacillus kandeliae]|uniref:NADH:flavin oxidoreductase/NADH oxidase n=1 Tax=Paenibacillus kandeliae TaxID=3231269 RepID=UPI003458CA9F